MVKLKDILIEGMYDRIVGRATKDVMKVVSKIIDNDFKSNGKVLISPPETKNFQSHLESTTPIFESEYRDKKMSFDFSLRLRFIETIQPGKLYINAFADEMGMGQWGFSELNMMIALNPNDGKTVLRKLNSYVREAMRHEIEHFTQRGSNVVPSKQMRNNNAIRARISADPKNGYKYLLLPDEVDANIHGLYARAKNSKQPYQKVVDDYLDSYVQHGDITQKQRDLIYKKWKQRVPKIGGIPKLK